MFQIKLNRKLRASCWLMLLAVTAWCMGEASGQDRSSFGRASAPGSNPVAEASNNSITALDIWPGDTHFNRLSEIGRGRGIIFSPDLSLPTNRRFYERLGFAYFEDADWRAVIRQVRAHNQQRPDERIEVLIVESHGTNGNGLKLQESHDPHARRSYISVGALQEKLEGNGVRLCVITACNAGRLFQPQIYRALNKHTNDPLFLPATLGIINASPHYTPKPNSPRVVYPGKSDLETINYGETGEFAPVTRTLLGVETDERNQSSAQKSHGVGFVISDILVQLLVHDPRLVLKTDGYVRELSRANFTNDESEELYQRFLALIDGIALSESNKSKGGPPAGSSIEHP
jgi:hypothetical protein